MNDLVKSENQLPATQGDPYLAYGRAVGTDTPFLKFVKGQFQFGVDDELSAHGTHGTGNHLLHPQGPSHLRDAFRLVAGPALLKLEFAQNCFHVLAIHDDKKPGLVKFRSQNIGHQIGQGRGGAFFGLQANDGYVYGLSLLLASPRGCLGRRTKQQEN